MLTIPYIKFIFKLRFLSLSLSFSLSLIFIIYSIMNSPIIETNSSIIENDSSITKESTPSATMKKMHYYTIHVLLSLQSSHMIPSDFDPYSVDIQLLQSFDCKVIQDNLKNIEKLKKKSIKSSSKNVISSQLPNIVEIIVNTSTPDIQPVNSQIVNDIIEASKPKKETKEKVVKEKEPKEKVVKEPKEKVAKEPKEKVAKEPKEKVVKETKEKVVKEPKEKVVKETKEKVVKEPKEKVVKEEIINIPEVQNNKEEVVEDDDDDDDDETEIECTLYTHSDGSQYLLDTTNNIYDVNTQEHIGTIANNVISLF